MSLEPPKEVNFFRGGSSHARGKRPPEVKINGVRERHKRHSLQHLDYAIFLKTIHHSEHHTYRVFFVLRNNLLYDHLQYQPLA